MMISTQWDVEIDVLVVGAGGCGLAAALAAYEQGVSVAVVEKMETPGGNTSLSTGSIPGAGSRFQKLAGIEDSPEKMYEDLIRKSGPHDVPELTRLLCNESAGLVEWLIDYAGVRLELITDYRHVGHSVPRLHAPASRKGTDLMKDLLRAVKDRDIPLALGNPVLDLVTDETGSVIGVVVQENNEGEYRIRTKKVILATNGFGDNRELLKRFCPEVAAAEYFGANGSKGEAIIWGETLGAQLGNMGAYQGYAALSKVIGSLMSWTTIEMGGFIVDRDGRRFGNESVGYSAFASKVMDSGEFAFAVYDKEIRDYTMAHEEEFREFVEMGGVKERNTVAELAECYGLKPEILSQSIHEYNQAASGIVQDSFGRSDFGFGPLQAPFAICKIVAGLFHTQGGLVVDDFGRVIGGQGGVIKNLFAGGGASAGVSGKSGAAGYCSGNGLLSAVGLGRIAGRSAAEEVKAGS